MKRFVDELDLPDRLNPLRLALRIEHHAGDVGGLGGNLGLDQHVGGWHQPIVVRGGRPA
jgi:hypothetical protein